MHDVLRMILHRCFHTDDWTLITFKEKNYAQCIAKIFVYMILPTLGSYRYVVELGCGVGDVVGNLEGLSKNERIGYDIQADRIWMARFLYPRCRFKKGGYQDICGNKISCLIIVNLLHFLEPSYVDEMLKTLVNTNQIQFIICDMIINSEYSSYKYEVDLKKYIGFSYEKIYRSRRLPAADGAGRYVDIYRKVNDK